jgi:hypothetical protein
MRIEIVQPFVPALRRNPKYYNLISRTPKKFKPTIKNNNLMKVITACLLLCMTVQSLHAQAADAQGPALLAIHEVTVVDVATGSLDPSQTVLIRGNMIETIGSTEQVRVPDDAEVVEAEELNQQTDE